MDFSFSLFFPLAHDTFMVSSSALSTYVAPDLSTVSEAPSQCTCLLCPDSSLLVASCSSVSLETQLIMSIRTAWCGGRMVSSRSDPNEDPCSATF